MADITRKVTIVLATDAEGTVTGIKLADGGIEKLEKRAKDAGATMEKTSEAGRLGFFALGNVVEDTAREFGIAGQASRKMGDAVERVSSSVIPAWGSAIGIAVLAVTGAVGVVKQFTEQKQREREEVEKHVVSLRGEVAELYQNRTASEEARRASYDLLNAKKALLKLELSKQIREDERAIREQEKALQSQINTYKFSAEALKGYDRDYTDMTAKMREEAKKQNAEKNATVLATIEISKKEIEANKIYMSSLKDVSFAEYDAGNSTEYSTMKMLEKEMAAARMSERMAQVATDYEAAGQRMAHQDEINTFSTQARGRIVNATYAAMENQLMKLVETHKFSVGELGKAVAQAVKVELVGVAARAAVWALYYTGMGLAAAASGNGASAGLYFSAAGEMAAVSGAALAGAAAVNVLSGPGGERGAVGSPTGYPMQTTEQASGPYTAPNPQADQNGTGWTPGATGGQTVINFNGPTYGIDDFNEKVNKAVQQNIADNGGTRRVIQRYA